MFIDLSECGGVLALESDSLPQFLRGVGSFDGFDVEVASSIVFADGCVSTVGEGARASIAEACIALLFMGIFSGDV